MDIEHQQHRDREQGLRGRRSREFAYRLDLPHRVRGSEPEALDQGLDDASPPLDDHAVEESVEGQDSDYSDHHLHCGGHRTPSPPSNNSRGSPVAAPRGTRPPLGWTEIHMTTLKTTCATIAGAIVFIVRTRTSAT